MRKIFDYKDIRKFEETNINKLIKTGIVVTATSELQNAMSLYYPDYRVYDIHNFISEIIPEWEENVKDIKNYVFLRNVIEDYVIDNEIREEVATYLRRNAGDMWNAIKLLIEADVYPDDISDNLSEPIRRFKDIWKKLELDNEQIVAFKSIFSYELSRKNVVLEKIEKIVGEMKEDIFLVGFYFITPLQDRIFDILEEAGFNLIFLNCHDNRYKYATQIWEKTFPEYSQGVVKEIQPELVLDNYFGEALDGKSDAIPIEITKHHTEFDFAEMVKEAVDKGEVVYSPDAKQCEQILKEYFPEFYDQKHLLSYPVGQYIYYLHMMWNSFSNQMDLEFEYVYKCFASGWLTAEEVNGRDYLFEVKLLEPYFKFCHSIEDWQERLAKLKEAKQVTSSFDERENGNKRWHRLQGNPFTNMAVYNLPYDTLDVINLLINKLIEDAKYLFAESTKTDLFEHFQKIATIIHQHLDKDELLNEETEIANELILQLSDETTRGIVCPMNGIRDAIIMLIGDHFEDYETQEEETSSKQRMVLPISMVEAAMLNNYGQKIHLVLANEFALPGQPKKLPWPLTEELMNTLDIDEREKTKRYVNDMRSVINNRPLSYRYLFYSFMGTSNSNNTPELSVEWVCKKENKDIDVSAYVKLLGLENKQIKDEIGTSNDIREHIEMNTAKAGKKIIDIPEKKVPDEVRMDYLLCKERYVYSYLLNELPSYSTEFHYSFELSKLISAFSMVSGIDKEIISENLAELFPFLRHIEIRQSTDFAKSQGTPEPIEFEGVEYPGQKLLTHYIDNEVISAARKKDDDFIETGKCDDNLPERACIYCPYSNICMKRHQKEVESYE